MQYLQGHFLPSPDLKEETYSALINKSGKKMNKIRQLAGEKIT